MQGVVDSAYVTVAVDTTTTTSPASRSGKYEVLARGGITIFWLVLVIYRVLILDCHEIIDMAIPQTTIRRVEVNDSQGGGENWSRNLINDSLVEYN